MRLIHLARKTPAIPVPFAPLLSLVILAMMAGCGYAFQTSKSAMVDRENIHRVYVAPIVNNSYKPGVENVVYNALLRTLAAHGQVELVRDRAAADAILEGQVMQANYLADATNSANLLNPIFAYPTQYGSGQYNQTTIATEYTATLTCSFVLTRPNPPPGKRKIVWGSTFTRAQPFLASNQLFSYGTTSALINESEFARAISNIAANMMGDVDESMLAGF